MINQLSKYLSVPSSLISFTLIASITALGFCLFNYSASIGESVGKFLFIITH
ncbi:hypothetical protein KDJ21_018440 [Metabacillus litoralis]|uniref:hypothetical protein n=1 Tax=Metabacillus TaxID=2675233 RepID=UPI001B917B85|nr:hypothetical protein [Metabacillus litoralis]UHA58791.1 hypothetical protein KDJ21_018440 [Metabacillus litoralis]